MTTPTPTERDCPNHRSLTIELPDGTVSTLTVDKITSRRAVVRSTIAGQPDKLVTFERRHPGRPRPGEPAGLDTWRWPGLYASLADWRVRQWLDSLAPEVTFDAR
jgi:hypothetical protein